MALSGYSVFVNASYIEMMETTRGLLKFVGAFSLGIQAKLRLDYLEAHKERYEVGVPATRSLQMQCLCTWAGVCLSYY